MRPLPLLAATAVVTCAVAIVLATRSQAVGKFTPPDESARLKAIGSTDGLPDDLQRAFAITEQFKAIAEPQPSDWLATQKETGQTFAQFQRAPRNRPDDKRNTIYLQPLGTFGDVEGHPTLEQMTDYTRAFFAMKVELLPTQPMKAIGKTSRDNNGKRQWLTGDILEGLAKRVPADAYCVLAVTMLDLYPDAAWNYVFGMASLRERVGVFSFARHDPAFYFGKRDAGWEKVMLERNCKVLTHEIGHMFAIKHCIYFECLMNGSNHLMESDSKPLHLCPCCLRKLHHSVGFDPAKRYDALRKLHTDNGLDEESKWLTSRVKALGSKSF